MHLIIRMNCALMLHHFKCSHKQLWDDISYFTFLNGDQVNCVLKEIGKGTLKHLSLALKIIKQPLSWLPCKYFQTVQTGTFLSKKNNFRMRPSYQMASGPLFCLFNIMKVKTLFSAITNSIERHFRCVCVCV